MLLSSSHNDRMYIYSLPTTMMDNYQMGWHWLPSTMDIIRYGYLYEYKELEETVPRDHVTFLHGTRLPV